MILVADGMARHTKRVRVGDEFNWFAMLAVRDFLAELTCVTVVSSVLRCC